MKILFLGGTRFVGFHMVDAAIRAGHSVTLFNRGTTNPDAFPDAEKLIGNRDGGLDALKGGAWDAVVDVNGYEPRLVNDTAMLLKNNAGRYVFVSTIDVYDVSRTPPDADEDAALKSADEEGYRASTYGGKPAYWYGRKKVLCEQVVAEAFPGKSMSLRLGWMAGPRNTDQLTYWARRMARGGDVLVPQAPSDAIQCLDARDLAAFTLKAIADERHGVFNAVGPATTWQAWLDAWQDVLGVKSASIAWLDRDWLDARLEPQGTTAFQAVPLSIARDQLALYRVGNARACEAGLVCRPLRDTVADIAAWNETLSEEERRRQIGLSPEAEAALLRAWRAA